MIYLDNAATTRIHPQVLASYSQVAQEFFANPSSAHGLGRKSRQLLEQARTQVGQLLKKSTLLAQGLKRITGSSNGL